MARLTVLQAARALGVSVRTMRRRIAEGNLPTATERRGKRDVTIIDAGDLAAYAEAHGYAMEMPQGTQAQDAQTGAGPHDTEGRSPQQAPGQATAEPGQTERNVGAESATGAETQGQVRALQAEVRALQDERDYLRRVLENVTKALPGPQEDRATKAGRPGWWARLRRRE